MLFFENRSAMYIEVHEQRKRRNEELGCRAENLVFAARYTLVTVLSKPIAVGIRR
jgi:hypothetical protein